MQILLIVHSQFNDLGRIRHILDEWAWGYKITNTFDEDLIKDDIKYYNAIIVFGGTMSVNDKDISEIQKEIKFIEEAIICKTPLIGICLGGQLISKALGAEVEKHPSGLVEIGFFPITPSQHGAPLFTETMRFYQWHQESLGLPDGATVLAHSDTFPIQAYQYENAVALQFHPDATPKTVRVWCELGKHRLCQPGAQSKDYQICESEKHDDTIDSWTRSLLRYVLK